MYGLFVALGSAAKQLSGEALSRAWKNSASCRIESLNFNSDIAVTVFTPHTTTAQQHLFWTPDKAIGVAMDGYLITDATSSETQPIHHLRRLAEHIQRHGIKHGLKSIISGSFNLVVIDSAAGRYYVANDRMGSIPLYYAHTDDGCLLSTNPVALAATGLFPAEIDYTACAEWAYIGYTIGDRYFLKQIKIFPHASMLQWDKTRRSIAIERTALDPFSILPSTKDIDTEEIVEKISAACRRLKDLGAKTAHLQSAGFDSRLILAAWPPEQALPCYTYGSPLSTEVMVAKSIAQTRGSSFTHVWPNGDAVADGLEAIFSANGLMVYPDRFFVARRISADGYESILDGFLGDALLGGIFYGCDRHFSPLSRYARLVTKFIDQKISTIGTERIAEALLDDIRELKKDYLLDDFFKSDLAFHLRSEKINIIQDIHNNLKTLIPANDSAAILFRNFKLANRSQHSIVQQGVMARQFVQVYYPFASDVELMELFFKIDPQITAYRRLNIHVFKRHFESYANLLHGDSLLPLRRSAFAHKLSQLFLSKGWNLPLLTGKPSGKILDFNNWHLWFKESQALREKFTHLLSENDLTDKHKVQAEMNQIASGRKKGSGKLFHLATIAQWINMTQAPHSAGWSR